MTIVAFDPVRVNNMTAYVFISLTDKRKIHYQSTVFEKYCHSNFIKKTQTSLCWCFSICSICCHDETYVFAENQQLFTLQDTCAALEQVVTVALSSALFYLINFDNTFNEYCKKNKNEYL